MQYTIFITNFAAEGGHAGDEFSRKGSRERVKDTKIAMP